MLGAVALVLLVACTNVTNLILARTVTRARECLVRTALGASRGRLVRQLLVETAVLFLAGGALGIVVARWSLDALLAFAIAGGYVPERLSVAVDARILAISLGVCLTAALLSGLGPALQASRLDLSSALKASGPTTSGGPKRRRARRLLIVAELAMTLVLLIGAGLLVRACCTCAQRRAESTRRTCCSQRQMAGPTFRLRSRTGNARSSGRRPYPVCGRPRSRRGRRSTTPAANGSSSRARIRPPLWIALAPTIS